MSESEPKKRRLKTDTGAVRVNLADEEGEDEEGEDAPADEKAGVDRKKVKDDAPDSAAGVDWKNEPCWEDLPEPLPLQEAPHCILFVGANNSDESELSLRKEAQLMEENLSLLLNTVRKRGGPRWSFGTTFSSTCNRW